jgi:hypothetical protein
MCITVTDEWSCRHTVQHKEDCVAKSNYAYQLAMLPLQLPDDADLPEEETIKLAAECKGSANLKKYGTTSSASPAKTKRMPKSLTCGSPWQRKPFIDIKWGARGLS